MLTAPLALAAFVLATQTAPSADCAALASAGTHTKFELLDANGHTHKAVLMRVDGSRALLRADDQVFAVPCDELQPHERPADRRWDGALIGLGVGVGLAALVAAGSASASFLNDNPDLKSHEPWGAEIAIMAASTALGYWIDSLHGGKKTVFVGRMPAAAPPSGVTLAVTGRSHERRLSLAYRVTF